MLVHCTTVPIQMQYKTLPWMSVEWGALVDLTNQRCFVFFFKLFLILTRFSLFQMKWCKEIVLTLLFSFMILSWANENQCPGNKTSCPDDSTCCRLHDGSYGCCPIKNAVCCQDSVHCCPGGFSCDVIKGVCQMGDKSKPLLKKIPAIPTVVCWWFIFHLTRCNKETQTVWFFWADYMW